MGANRVETGIRGTGQAVRVITLASGARDRLPRDADRGQHIGLRQLGPGPGRLPRFSRSRTRIQQLSLDADSQPTRRGFVASGGVSWQRGSRELVGPPRLPQPSSSGTSASDVHGDGGRLVLHPDRQPLEAIASDARNLAVDAARQLGTISGVLVGVLAWGRPDR